jgi:multidrug efflux pump subunit AcrA (membrane-fusion protein)
VRTVPVEVTLAQKIQVPVRIDALGTVTPIASVAVKTRVDSEIIGVHFRDGAIVRQGDLLFTLDSRAIEAQIKQVTGVLEGAKAQLDQAERDVARYTELFAKNATTQVTLNNARTQVTLWRASVNSNTGQLEHLRIQLSYCTIRAPIYVTFAMAQRELPEVREALRQETTSVEAIVAGEDRRANGQVSVIENTVDPSTGMVMVRAAMPNTDEVLWPGTLVTVRLTLREEEAVVVPSVAVQVSQAGTFVFVVKDGAVQVRPVKVARVVDSRSVIESGLDGGETVVTDGHLQLSNGTKVAVRNRKAGS